MGIYLDYNATTPIDSRVLAIMNDVYQDPGNADSRTHEVGENARKIIEESRKNVAKLIGCETSEVFFTSGATESNNIAILGLRDYGKNTGKDKIITTSIEHKAVREAAKSLEGHGIDVEFVNPNSKGVIDPDEIEKRLSNNTLIVSVMHANNETGMIQPVKEIGERLAGNNVLFHIDATQTFGKLVDEVRMLTYDMMSIAAHKMGGPQGIGALILRKTAHKLPPVKPIMFGGQQEHGIRPGTLPTALIAGFGKACELRSLEYKSNVAICQAIKEGIMKELNNSGLVFRINGDIEKGMPNTLNIALDGISSEALMIAARKVCCISNGSACNSNTYEPSYVLKAMGLSDEEISNSIRVSWGADQNSKEITEAFSRMLAIAKQICGR